MCVYVCVYVCVCMCMYVCVCVYVCRAVRNGAAGAARATVEKFVIIARVHSLLSSATPH